MSVYSYDLVPQKSAFWTKTRDAHLRSFYTDTVKVDPAIIAFFIGTTELRVIKRLSELGLRSRRAERNVQPRSVDHRSSSR
jgi:hypothetical protein